MPRKKTSVRKRKISIVPEWKLNYLLYGTNPLDNDVWEKSGQSYNIFDAFDWDSYTVWIENKDQILPDWIKKHPGTRPCGWWDYEAPRQPKKNNGEDYDGYLPEDRKILEAPKCMVRGPYTRSLEEAESFFFGVADTDDYLYDLQESGEDPVIVVESQAAYLERFGLLTAAEKKKLSSKDFEPETIKIDLSCIED